MCTDKKEIERVKNRLEEGGSKGETYEYESEESVF